VFAAAFAAVASLEMIGFRKNDQSFLVHVKIFSLDGSVGHGLF
jgi:hypothetical protein